MRESGIALLAVAAACVFLGKAITIVPFVPLLIVVSVFLFIFAFIYTDWAMILLIFAMLLSPEITAGAVSSRQDIIIRIDDLLIVVFMFAWLARSALVKHTRLIRKLPLNRFIFFYTMVFLVSTMKGMIVGNVTPIKGFFFTFKYIEYFMVFYLAAGILQDRKQLISYLKAFIIVFAIVNIYAFSQVSHVQRVSAPFEGRGEPNTLGGYMVLMLAIVMGLLIQTRLRQWRWPLTLLSVLTLVPFGHTLSRASYAAFIAMYLSLIAFSKFSAKAILTMILFAGVILFLVVKPAQIVDRLKNAVTPEYQQGIPTAEVFGVKMGASASARIWDWVELFHTWQSKPVLGYGVTGVRFVDSQFMKVFVETGLLGLTAFLCLLFTTFWQTLKIYKTTKDDLYKGLALGFLAAHVGMVVHAITANTFIIIRIMEPYWFLAAMVMMIPELEKPKTVDVKPAAPEEKRSYIRNAQFLLNSGWKP